MLIRSWLIAKLSPARPPPERITIAAPSASTIFSMSIGWKSPVSAILYVSVEGSSVASPPFVISTLFAAALAVWGVYTLRSHSRG